MQTVVAGPGRAEPGRPRLVASIPALIGGLLWIPYGVFEMLRPLGEDRAYRGDRGYEVVTDGLVYRVYALPGGLALLLTSVALLRLLGRMGLPRGRARTASRTLAALAAGLAIVGLAGVLVPFDPLFTGPRIFGTLALGAAMCLAGWGLGSRPAVDGRGARLLVLGALGLFLLPLWPLVYAAELIPEMGGAATIALFGLGWVLLGVRPASAGHPIAGG